MKKIMKDSIVNNLGYREDKDAVSPVIAVILMVAITVVLASVVFVLVTEVTEPVKGTPRIQFSVNEGNASAKVLSATPGASWSDFTVTGCTTPTGAITAGQDIYACAGRATVVHKASNSLVWDYEFPAA